MAGSRSSNINLGPASFQNQPMKLIPPVGLSTGRSPGSLHARSKQRSITLLLMYRRLHAGIQLSS